MSPEECPAELLSDLLAVAGESDERGLERVEALLRDYGGDARLHFLRGSLLASMKLYDQAQEAMSHAVAAAPGFDIARFQLGFLQFTSGDAAAAERTWGPLERVPKDHHLRLFASGLNHLARNELNVASALLEQGIKLNVETLPINGDMRLIVDEIRRKQSEQAAIDEPISSAQLLLNPFGRPTKH